VRIGKLERLLEVIENEMSDRIRELAKRKIIENNLLTNDELETLHAAYGNAQKEISDLKNHNDILIKRVKRLERRSGKLGKDLLKCKNELRNPSPDKDEWKQFNKANRQGK